MEQERQVFFFVLKLLISLSGKFKLEIKVNEKFRRLAVWKLNKNKRILQGIKKSLEKLIKSFSQKPSKSLRKDRA